MKSYAQILQEVDMIQTWIDEHEHNDRHNKYIAINVKIYADVVNCNDIDTFLKTLPFTDEQKDYLSEEVITDKWITDQFNWYLEDQARYLTEEFLKGCAISSPDYWNTEIEKVLTGVKTGYPSIDRKRSEKTKIAVIKRWMYKDQKEQGYLDLLDEKAMGFFGRSGGWFAIANYNTLESLIDSVEISEEYKEKEDALYYLKQAKELYNAFKWLYETIEGMHKGIPTGWKEELEFRLSEELENFCGEDCEIEQKLQAITD